MCEGLMVQSASGGRRVERANMNNKQILFACENA